MRDRLEVENLYQGFDEAKNREHREDEWFLFHEPILALLKKPTRA